MTRRLMMCFRVVVLFVAGAAFGQPLPGSPGAAGPPARVRPLSVHIQPTLLVPLSDSTAVFSSSGALGLMAEYAFSGNPQPFVSAGLDYAYLPVKDGSSSVSMLTGMAGGGLYFWLSPRLGTRLSALAGFYYGLANDGGAASGYAAVDAGARLEYLLTPAVNVALGAGYRYDLGTFQGLTACASTSIFLSGREVRQTAIAEARRKGQRLGEAKTPEKGRGIELAEVELKEIFPVFYKFYDDNPVGSAVLVNQEKDAVSDIKLSFFVKQYMDSPKPCPTPPSLAAGERKTVDIMGLLANRVLEVTEATKVAAELVLEYRMDGELYRDTRTVTVRIMDRNAMSWDDDRKAAAFVTAKDPAVVALAKEVAGLVRETASNALNANMTTAMGLFMAMELFGLSYVVDPKTPFVEFSKNESLVDYLQFPRQTLGFKAGDCDDLSVLFAALLEAVGVETAFVTVPGHIFLAFSTNLRPEEASRAFGSPGELITQGSQVWIPLEATIRRGGFMKAWAEAAKQWRDASSRGTARLYPVHEAWRTYESVQAPEKKREGKEDEGEVDVVLPERGALAAAFQREIVLFVDREISPRVARLEDSIRQAGGDPQARNRLGILYAQYGRHDQAEAEFLKAAAVREYLPALLNLGNLALLQGKAAAARDYFQRASRNAPNDPKVLLGLALALREAGQPAESLSAYQRLAVADRSLAERYAYLGSTADTAGRAAGAGGPPAVLWAEE